MINNRRIKPLWVSTAILDVFLHNASLIAIIKEFRKSGHTPYLLAVRSVKPISEENSSVNITAVPLRFMPVLTPILFAIVSIFFLPIYILKSGVDFVIFDPDIHILSAFPSFIVCKLRKIKLVLDIRSVPVETAGTRGFLRRFWFVASILIAKKMFDGFTIITQLMKQEICGSYNLDFDKMGVWTSGVDEALFDPAAHVLDGVELRKKLNLTNRFIVFYHGILTQTRGLLETIEALKLLLPKFPDVVFVILGSGYFKTDIESKIKDYKIDENVLVLDPVSIREVPKFISICNVGIVPLPDNSYWRFQSPLKLLEYLSMGKTVIISDIPAHRLVVKEEKCGIYLSSVSPIEIARAIEYAISNKSNLDSWGKVGRVIIEQQFTWQKVSKELESYLMSL